jgi:hypothetical protein
MTQIGRMIGSLAAAGLLAAGPAGAKGNEPGQKAKTPPNSVSGVTVTAPEKPNPLVNRTTQFVREHLPQTQNEQYARFRDEVCVKVQGLPPEFDAFVAKRIVELARQVRAPVAKAADCTPNVNVIFTAQPQEQLSDIAKRRDILFGYYLKPQAKRVTTFSRPIQSWYLSRAVGTDGVDMLELYDGAPCVSSGAPGAPPCDIKSPAVKGRAGSRLGNDMSSELVHSLILADTNRVAGEKIDAVANYVAVLALSRWQGLERCNAIPTILNLMAENCAEDAPEAATSSDLGLLTALYSVDPRETGSQQRMSIASRMQAERKKDASGQAPH